MSSEHQIIVTSIVRLSDGLPLVAGSEPSNATEDVRAGKLQMKKVLDALGKQGAREPEVCVALGSLYVLYIIQDNVVFTGLFVKAYSQQYAASYLGELRKEFFQKYDKKVVANASVAFALMDFEKFIEKSKRAFEQTKTNRNLSQVQGTLSDIHKVS
jgi:vesicle transport protein SEC22